MNNKLFFLSIFMMIALFSCKNDNQEKKQEEEILPDSILNTEGMSEAEKAEYICLTHNDYICETGLFFVRLGDFIGDLQAEEIEGASISDSVVSESGYQWVVRTMQLPEGRIIVEGEFIDERQSNDTLLSNTRVNRLRIESPLFQTPDQLKVGDSVTRLLELYPEESFQVVSIPDYEVINIQVGNSRYNYLVSDKGNAMASSIAGDVILVDDLPREAMISGIVVM
ncbi:MAG: hypothetical protein KDE26_21155 [Bacteroidetes bacterium]|nr:hypothetical protein [Bacteroidota bacterium]MCB0845778.1 hypothetical protein [Bacteroidota bacterium]